MKNVIYEIRPMNIQPNRPLSPAAADIRPAEVALETVVGQAALATLPPNEGPSSLAGREVALMEPAVGSAVAAADVAFEFWGAELGEDAWDFANEVGPWAVLDAPIAEFVDPVMADRLARQQTFNERLTEWETAHGREWPELRGLDVDATELDLFVGQRLILPRVFSCLSRLQKLHIHGDGIPVDLAHHPSLRRLKVSGCSMLSDGFRECLGLEQLVIDTASAFDIPDWLGELTNLQEIAIEGPVQKLPSSIGQLIHLQDLRLLGVDVRALPNKLVNCRMLSSLEIGSCSQLNRLPKRLFNLPLESLTLSFCDSLRYIPKGIERCQTLVDIHWTHLDSLQKLPVGLSELRNLEQVNFWRNNERRLPAAVFSSPRLECLKCDRDDILALPVKDFLFEGHSEPEKELELGEQERLLDVLQASDEDGEYQDLLVQTNVENGSADAPQVIGVRSRFAGLFVQRHRQEQLSDQTKELKSLVDMHEYLETELADSSAPKSEALVLFHAALRAAVIPDADLRLRRMERQFGQSQR
jgi:hypothetical protein